MKSSSDRMKSFAVASPSQSDASVPAIAVAKKTSIIDARATSGAIRWRR
jgi:hypothetical protein